MSIVYGSFGQILQKTVSTGTLTNNVNEVYFSIPWANSSIVRDITVYAPDATVGTAVTFAIPFSNSHVYASKKISSIPAAGLAYSTSYYLNTTTSENGNSKFAAAANIAGRGEIGAYTEDIYNRNYLNVMVRFDSPITKPVTLKVSGQKTYQTSYTKTDNIGIDYIKDLSVVIKRGSSIIDITPLAKSTGSASNPNDFYITSASDYIYVGSTKKYTIFDFKIGTPSTGTGTSLNAQFWNGSSWSNVRVLDNTSSDMIRNTFRYSGIVELNELASLGTSWAPTTLDSTVNAALINDPTTTLVNSIKAGTVNPIGMLVNPQRYWVRFNNFALNEKIQLAGLLPVA